MSMPTIPREPFRPNRDEVVIDLLKSIALEETAIAHLLNAEAEKIQFVVGKMKDVEFPHDTFTQLSNQVIKLMDVVVMKEWLLLRKLENAMIFQESELCKDCDDDEPEE